MSNRLTSQIAVYFEYPAGWEFEIDKQVNMDIMPIIGKTNIFNKAGHKFCDAYVMTALELF